jgi:antitoxin (DNA-binding transcriptional repressor) of toxin-antitoxin stability system
MEVILITELAANILKAVDLAQRGVVISIVDSLGKVVAQIVPADVTISTSRGDAFERTKSELNRLIGDIAPYLPEQVDAVQTIREIRE